jgi:nucleoside-diphosphate-sugar epimerase
VTVSVVLLGGSGFIGSAIGRQLPDAVAPSHSEVDVRDPAAVRRAISPGDVVINATGYANATDRTAAGRARLRASNVEAVRCLAEASAERGAAQLIHLSSVAAMGRRQGVMLTEDDIAEPTSPYAVSKRDAERVLASVGEPSRVTILRPTSVFGAGRGLAATLCRVAAMPVVPLPAGGRALIPFTYVDTVAEAVVASIGNERCLGRTFIVGDPTSYTLRSIVRGLAAAMGHSPRIVGIPSRVARLAGRLEAVLARARGRPPLLDETRLGTLTNSISFSTDAFRAATGFTPTIDFEEALRRLAAWYVERRATCP